MQAIFGCKYLFYNSLLVFGGGGKKNAPFSYLKGA
jgi:hypothetical protein